MKRTPTVSAIVLMSLAVAAVLIASLLHRQSATQTSGWSGGMIDTPGVYARSGSNQIIRVWIDADGLVQYGMDSAGGTALFNTALRMSAYSRWFMFADDRGYLWVSSGDIGLSVVRPDPTGSFTEVPLDRGSAVWQLMPRTFADHIAGRLQR